MLPSRAESAGIASGGPPLSDRILKYRIEVVLDQPLPAGEVIEFQIDFTSKLPS